MKRLLLLGLAITFLLAACGADTSALEAVPIEVTAAQEMPAEDHEMMVEPTAAAEELAGEADMDEPGQGSAPESPDSSERVLPTIPQLSYVDDEWFTPTPPEQISLASGRVQLFDFSAIWCTYCRGMAPIFHGLEQLYSDQINFVMLDMDRDGANEYGPFLDALNYNPAFRPGLYILAPDGTVLNAWLGPVDAIVLQNALLDALEAYQ